MDGNVLKIDKFDPNSASEKACLKVNYRSSHQRCSIKKDVLKNFANFTGKHLCQSPFFNKVAGLRPATLSKRDSGKGVFQ